MSNSSINTFFEEFQNLHTCLFSHSQLLNFFHLFRSKHRKQNHTWFISAFVRRDGKGIDELITEIRDKLTLKDFISTTLEGCNYSILFEKDEDKDIPVLLLDIDVNVSSASVKLYGDKDYINKYKVWFEEEYETTIITFTTITSIEDGCREVISNSISKSALQNYVPAFFPNFDFSLKDYIESFKNSKSNLLVLIGEPGTGKTSFLRNACQYFGPTIIVMNSHDVITHKDAIPIFQRDDSRLLILEDADIITRKRENDNTIMSTLLNAIDGLVNFDNKKFIISTNLPSLKDVDEALIRPGRCFDILKFTPLTKQQAMAARQAIGKPIIEIKEESLTLAHALNYDEIDDIKKRKQGILGFIDSKEHAASNISGNDG